MKKLSIQDAEQRIKQRFPDENFIIVEYTGIGGPGTIKCMNCGKLIDVSHLSNFLAKTKKFGCSECQSKLIKKRKYMREVLEQYYDFINEKVIDTHINYTIRCKNCGHERTSTLKNLYEHLDCGCKTGVYRNRTAEEFLEEANKNALFGSYQLVSNYKDQTKKVLLQHSCGFIWEVRPSDVIHGRSFCPKCGRKKSKAVCFIEKFLQQYNIDFQMEKRLDNSKQRFDFYLENSKHKIAIEYNGMQHYHETTYFYPTLVEQQERDERKKKYCEEHGILLYVIPYTYSNQDIIQELEGIINKFND